MMKAAVLVENQKIEIQEINIPAPNKDECKIKVKNVGVCSSDIQRGFGGGAYFYPLVMGHEISGEIAQVGENVSNFSKGDRVAIFPLLPCFKCKSCQQRKYVRCTNYGYYGSRVNGGYAEYVNIKAWNLIKIDKKVDFRDIACLEPVSVVLHSLNRIKISEYGDKKLSIAIIGAGFLGLIAAQILSIKFPHHEVTIIDRNDFKLNIAKNYTPNIALLSDDKAWEEFLNNGNRNKFDITIEATGAPQSFINSIEITCEGGTTLWMGNIVGDLTIKQKTVSSILRKEINIIGTWNSDYDPEAITDDWRESVALIINHGIKPSQFVSSWIKLEEIPTYLSKLYNHKMRKEKIEWVKIMAEL